MYEIRDPEIREAYLQTHKIRDLFDTRQLPFRLYRYDVGEMMNILRPTREYLKFVVEGSFDLYAVRPDGTRHMVYRSEGFTLLGDLEFCGKTAETRYHEVTKTVYAIELPIESLRPKLKEDVRFLNFLLDTLSAKLSDAVTDMGAFPDLTEALLYHIRYQCPERTITSVSKTASRLNYSLRQTQRVLRELTCRGILRRTGKGIYILNEETQ